MMVEERTSDASVMPASNEIDSELASLLRVTRRLPRTKRVREIPRRLWQRYIRMPRKALVADVLDFRMHLNPMDYSDGSILFAPQLYNAEEICFLKERLKRGDIFLDVGAHIGFYSLCVSGIVGFEGIVLAIEADPDTVQRLRYNIELNRMTNIRCVHRGVSDRREVLRLGQDTLLNSGSNSFHSDKFMKGIDIQCMPLLQILEEQQITKVAGAKFDIEGFECCVLSQFFKDAAPSLYPRFLVVELNWKYYPEQATSALELLKGRGYRVHQALKSNYLLELTQ
ncbi:MAG: FkbM family methyltransferase [Armatimonadota bacterium]|nr:FkbM family methyltransferase [Armatimonadota bacterium]